MVSAVLRVFVFIGWEDCRRDSAQLFAGGKEFANFFKVPVVLLSRFAMWGLATIGILTQETLYRQGLFR